MSKESVAWKTICSLLDKFERMLNRKKEKRGFSSESPMVAEQLISFDTRKTNMYSFIITELTLNSNQSQ